MGVGEKLERWRSSHGLNQREAAKLARISQAAWQAVESNRVKRIGLDVARAIVAVTEGAVSLDDFGAKRRARPSTPPPKRAA